MVSSLLELLVPAFPLLSVWNPDHCDANLFLLPSTYPAHSTLLCKVFLQHLGALLSLEEFTGLWLRVLDYMDKYMHAGQSELLLEAVSSVPPLLSPPGQTPQ